MARVHGIPEVRVDTRTSVLVKNTNKTKQKYLQFIGFDVSTAVFVEFSPHLKPSKVRSTANIQNLICTIPLIGLIFAAETN